ncbi:hypothetical protein K435DRAFT_860839 [Dendrothele bispora CBS 962.96]|uniref:Uncharacterized protein n=1 Tax=Dendrothele bispora (strain CBS 962.96) TaxID=1314807 RepID=A0A4S8LX18_DENBC|nr:hypothetical protein K435DRAFT_860839 [Dendrothele bispora CBS 962.96]
MSLPQTPVKPKRRFLSGSPSLGLTANKVKGPLSTPTSLRQGSSSQDRNGTPPLSTVKPPFFSDLRDQPRKNAASHSPEISGSSSGDLPLDGPDQKRRRMEASPSRSSPRRVNLGGPKDATPCSTDTDKKAKHTKTQNDYTREYELRRDGCIVRGGYCQRRRYFV